MSRAATVEAVRLGTESLATHACAFVLVFVRSCVRACVRACTRIRLRACVRVCAFVRVYVCLCTRGVLAFVLPEIGPAQARDPT